MLVKDKLIRKKVIRKDTYIFTLPSSLKLLEGISVNDSVIIVFTNGKLTDVDIRLKGTVNKRNTWHVNTAVNNMIFKLEKEY